MIEKNTIVDFLFKAKNQIQQERTITYKPLISIVKLKYKKQETQVLEMETKTHHRNKETKKKVAVTGDSMLNGISRKELNKSHKVTVEKFPGETANITVENINQQIQMM